MPVNLTLIPTIEFLEYVSEINFSTENEYYIGFSTYPAEFCSTTNSEFLCLNDEKSLLSSIIKSFKITEKFKNQFNETIPILTTLNGLKILDKNIESSQSVFIYKSNGESEKIILNSNFNKDNENITTAPLLDCFSRECSEWFNSKVDWFIGFGTTNETLPVLVDDNNAIILSKSDEILNFLIIDSKKQINHTSINFTPPTESTPFLTIEFCTGIEYIRTDTIPDCNILFIFNSNSIVSFGGNVEKNDFHYYDSVKTKIYFENEEVIII